MSNSKATVTALKSASTTKKKRRTMTKVERTQNMLIRALDKVDGDYAMLDRPKMLGQLQKTLQMKEANQASTYYHNALRAHQTGTEAKRVIIKL